MQKKPSDMYPLSARDGAIDYSQNNRVAIIVNHRSDKQQLAPELDDKARRREAWKTSVQPLRMRTCNTLEHMDHRQLIIHVLPIITRFLFVCFLRFFMFLTCFSLTINFFLIFYFIFYCDYSSSLFILFSCWFHFVRYYFY